MSKTQIISEDNVKSLKDIQVAFKLRGGLVEIEQIESYSPFTGFYETLDLEVFSPSALARIEQICAEWYNANVVPDYNEYSQDDLNPPPRAA